MSLKKRMFRSNMMILSAALCALMLIILAVFGLFEDSLERQLYVISQTRIDGNAEEVASLMEQPGMQSPEALSDMVEQYGYRTAVITDGKVLSGDDGEEMQDLAAYFETDGSVGTTEVVAFRKATVVAKLLERGQGYLVAVHFPGEKELAASLNQSFYAFLGMLFLAGAGGIVCLLILASHFTKKMNRMVMEPLELLTLGAERIKNGNLKEDILYQGEAEFEHVCQTFNDMQHTILEDQEQRAKTERARIDMVTGISHDLRTPLTSIRGYIKGVLDGVADTEEKKKMYLRTAYGSTEEMNILLQKLFDFSKMESGQMPFHMVKADLAEYVASYVAEKEAVLDPQALNFHLEVKAEWIPEISMDVEQVRRILDNLLENSQKYAMVTPVEVELSVEETKEAVLLSWKDNGKGVPEEKLPRLFERFYRCDEARQEKGSGVGLYVVNYIMERHHGRVTAENDGGLRIRMYFPKEDFKIKSRI